MVALWADDKHLLEVLELLESINEVANMTEKSAYEVMNKTIEDLTTKLDATTKENVSLKADIKKLTTPHNKLFDSCLYARRYGNYIHIKYRKEVIAKSAAIDKVIPMVNAADVLVDFKYYAKKLGLIQSIDSKWVAKYKDREKIYKMIEEIKDNTFDIYAYTDTVELIDDEIAKLTVMKTTTQRTGKIVELEYCKSNSFIPWEFIPTHVLNKYNCLRQDSGIDFVEVNDGIITTIGQVKYRSGSNITGNDILTFITKCEDSRFSNCKKKLILKGCNISKRLQKQLLDIEIKMI